MRPLKRLTPSFPRLFFHPTSTSRAVFYFLGPPRVPACAKNENLIILFLGRPYFQVVTPALQNEYLHWLEPSSIQGLRGANTNDSYPLSIHGPFPESLFRSQLFKYFSPAFLPPGRGIGCLSTPSAPAAFANITKEFRVSTLSRFQM